MLFFRQGNEAVDTVGRRCCVDAILRYTGEPTADDVIVLRLMESTYGHNRQLARACFSPDRGHSRQCQDRLLRGRSPLLDRRAGPDLDRAVSGGVVAHLCGGCRPPDAIQAGSLPADDRGRIASGYRGRAQGLRQRLRGLADHVRCRSHSPRRGLHAAHAGGSGRGRQADHVGDRQVFARRRQGIRPHAGVHRRHHRCP